MSDLRSQLIGLATDLMPTRDPLIALALIALALLLLLAGTRLDRVRAHLRDQGVLPWLLSLLQGALRAAAVLISGLASLAFVPDGLLPLLPFVMLAATLGLGWALIQWLPDVLAGLTLLIEGRLHAGHSVEVGPHAGVLTWIGMRTTRLQDVSGRIVHLPNRLLLDTVAHDPARWPEVLVPVRVPPAVSSTLVQQRLEEIGALSPWRAPNIAPRVLRDADDPQLWRVATRLIDLRFRELHVRAVLGMAEDAFTPHDD
jgi:small-conductance mechanosensitive channel